MWLAFGVLNELEQGRVPHGMTPKLWQVVDIVSSTQYKCRMAFSKIKEQNKGRNPKSEDESAREAAMARQQKK